MTIVEAKKVIKIGDNVLISSIINFTVCATDTLVDCVKAGSISILTLNGEKIENKDNA